MIIFPRVRYLWILRGHNFKILIINISKWRIILKNSFEQKMLKYGTIEILLNVATRGKIDMSLKHYFQIYHKYGRIFIHLLSKIY